MKRILYSTILWLAGHTAMATHLQGTVDSIINHVDPSINMGMVVVDLNTGETLYQRNPNQVLIPASNMKLFSEAAALLALGPDYRFQNQLTTDATLLEKGRLKGSLYLYLPGDPSLTQMDLDQLLSQLPSWGIKRIQGNVVLVSNNGTIPPYAPGRAPSDFKYSYGAPVAPLMLDENRLTITVNPSYRAGDSAFIELNEQHDDLPIDNQVKTASHASGCGVGFNIDESNHLVARGCVGVGQWAVQQRIAIQNPLRYSQELIRAHLKKQNVILDGQVILGSAPAKTLLLASHASEPITRLMAKTLKPSDNLYADSLFLHTAAKLNGSPVSWPEAEPIIKHFLQQQTGINLQNAVLIDGSGLSRQDRITAQQTVDLLRFLHNAFPLAYEYIAALPIAGQDGTLQRRFRKPTQQGFLRAKTGTMTGVMSLSGYLYSDNAHTLAFAIYINRRPGTKPSVSGQYRSLVDHLCDFFLHQKPDSRTVAENTKAHTRVAFQQQPTEYERQRGRFSKWRGLESAVKQALKGQAVTVLFRNNQLVLKDNDANINHVWSILQGLSKKYAFTVALRGKTTPANSPHNPQLLWIKTSNHGLQASRTWTLRDAVG